MYRGCLRLDYLVFFLFLALLNKLSSGCLEDLIEAEATRLFRPPNDAALIVGNVRIDRSQDVVIVVERSSIEAIRVELAVSTEHCWFLNWQMQKLREILTRVLS